MTFCYAGSDDVPEPGRAVTNGIPHALTVREPGLEPQ